MKRSEIIAKEHLRIAREYFSKAKSRGVSFRVHHLTRLLKQLPLDIKSDHFDLYWKTTVIFDLIFSFPIGFNEDRTEIIIKESILKGLLYAKNPLLSLLPKDDICQSAEIKIPFDLRD